MAPVATHTEAPEKVEQLTLDGVAKELGPVAYRFSTDLTGAIHAYVVRLWPRHPRRVIVVVYALLMMGGRGWTDETSGQLAAALDMNASSVRNHLAAAATEGVLLSTGCTSTRRLSPGILLTAWIEHAQLVRSGADESAPSLSAGAPQLVRSGADTPQRVPRKKRTRGFDDPSGARDMGQSEEAFERALELSGGSPASPLSTRRDGPGVRTWWRCAWSAPGSRGCRDRRRPGRPRLRRFARRGHRVPPAPC